jgi:hypothetical protein
MVHCEVIARCSKTGVAKSFQIGGPEGATNWQKLWYGLIPPKTSPPVGDRAPNQSDYAASCDGDDCGCKAFDCLQKAWTDARPPPYYALWQNSNSFAHSLLNQCGCSLKPYLETAIPGIGPVYSQSPRNALGW